MEKETKSNIIILYIIAILGASIFYFLHIPLPWILGPLTLLLIWKHLTHKWFSVPTLLKQASFSITGVQIGTTFTTATLSVVFPFLLPYTFFTLLLIAASMLIAILISKKSKVDSTTSLLGSIPGGLSVMVALVDSLKGNTGLVAIFHTIRLMAVLFLLPFIATHFLLQQNDAASSVVENNSGNIWTLLIFIPIFLVALYLDDKLPASTVIIPMFFMAIFRITGVPIADVPALLFILAQLTIGMYLAQSISLKQVKAAGKHAFIFLGLALFLIFISILFGIIFSYIANIDMATAILSLAPGGLIEMALTAEAVGGDPSIVGSLQLVRMLLIVLLFPPLLKLYFNKQKRSD
ncbi:hypothetical protein DFR57_112153 [Saliterribacillus persicus]|uniref:AbrB family transcriptional regulator n=2 Tax=Saliterribacillus persicus TaxID=930114 RepID=A0A368XG37_9BACI|nr:hypothetical protein DFR57_112153 [Saliterribacillus persicus]